MTNRPVFRPALDPLENRVALTGGLAAAAQSGLSLERTVPNASALVRSNAPTVPLSGSAHGFFTVANESPGSGLEIRGHAEGSITPLREASITARFFVPGSGSQTSAAEGFLTIRSRGGTLTLRLFPATANGSTNASSSTLEFTFDVIRGTGRFHDAQGSGAVQVTLEPRPGSSTVAHGSVTLVFGR